MDLIKVESMQDEISERWLNLSVVTSLEVREFSQEGSRARSYRVHFGGEFVRVTQKDFRKIVQKFEDDRANDEPIEVKVVEDATNE